MPISQPSTYRQTTTTTLLSQYRTAPTPQLRNQIVQLNLGLVRREAHRWAKQCAEIQDDLIQVGVLGLIRAIERFDLQRGYAFSSFALPYIRGEIQHYLRDKSPSIRIPRSWLALRQQSVKVSRELARELQRQPTDVEVAIALQIPLEQWQDIKLAYRNQAPLSLDSPVRDGDEGQVNLVDLVADPQYRSFQLAQEDRLRLQQALVQLEHKTREILEFVFLQDLTQKEVAEQLNISVITVSRRVRKGVKALQSLMLRGDER
ncbi:MAG: RNA polymerase sigma factor SigF [Spirulina sp. SIO3F2]|nr:RNA polymerase sigma factor SigF [Spirulina sp. SIO3F2]